MADSLTEFGKALETNAVQAVKLMEKITGIGASVPELMSKIQSLNQQLYGLSVVSSGLGRDFDQVKNQMTGVMRQFNFTAESVISMQKTLTVGFREPIDDIESFQNLLNRSRQIFGNNEAAAKMFIEQLAKLDAEAIGLRDSFIELMQVMGRTEGLKTGTQAEIERGNALRDLTRSQIEMKYRIGEINREEYLSYMKLINGKNEAEEKLLRITEKVQQSRQATSALESTMIKFGDSEALAEVIGFFNNFGSGVAALGIDALTNQLESYAKARKDVGSTEIGKEEKAIIDSIIAGAKSKEEAIDRLKGALGDEAEEVVNKNLSVIADNLAKSRIEQANAAQTYDQILAGTLPKEKVREYMMNQINERNRTLLENYRQIKTTLDSNIESLRTMANLSAYAGSNMDFSGTGFSEQELSKQAEVFNKVAEERRQSILAGIAEMEAYETKFASLNKEGYEKEAEKIIEKRRLDAELASQAGAYEAANKLLIENEERQKQLNTFRQTGNIEDLKFLTSKTERDNQRNKYLNELQKIELERIEAERSRRSAILEKRLSDEKVTTERLQAQNDVLQSQISLMDSLAVGIGANAQIREQAAQNLIEQARQEESMIKDIQKLRSDALSDSKDINKTDIERKVAAETVTKLEIELGKHIANRNNLNKQALDQLQKLREGYLEAVNYMESGAGMFTEIVADQNKNLGALIRTTEEVPRVLRTGAGSGGITQASQFGPGGLIGGFNPKSEEYSKHVITSMDDLQKLVENLPKQIGENIAIAAKARPEYEGHLVGAAESGKAGPINAPAIGPTVTGMSAEGTTSAVLSTPNIQSSAITAISNIDMSNMTKEIADVIKRGVVEAVKKGMSSAVSELAKQVAPE